LQSYKEFLEAPNQCLLGLSLLNLLHGNSLEVESQPGNSQETRSSYFSKFWSQSGFPFVFNIPRIPPRPAKLCIAFVHSV